MFFFDRSRIHGFKEITAEGGGKRGRVKKIFVYAMFQIVVSAVLYVFQPGFDSVLHVSLTNKEKKTRNSTISLTRNQRHSIGAKKTQE